MARTARPLIQLMRVWLAVDVFLVAAAGFQLFVLTERTDAFFAWTIAVPLTAAFLGASYWSAIALLVVAFRQSVWERARISVFGVWVFTVLTSIATLLHLDLFHTDSIYGIAWLVVYIAVPIVLVPLVWVQQRMPMFRDASRIPLPPVERAVLLLLAVLLVGAGALLFVGPTTFDWLWPWRLSELTGRAVAAWLVGLGLTSLQATVENDDRRSVAIWPAQVIFAVLQFVALARYGAAVDWNAPPAWILILVYLTILVMGVAGMMRTRELLSGRTNEVRSA